MKYIFHIHSNINYLCAVLIIANDNIAPKDVIFLCFRGIRCSSEFGRSIEIENSIYLHPFNSPRNIYKLRFFKNSKYINHIDKCIEDVIGTNDFTYYAPHCKNPIYAVLISHPNCVQLHYIEDGMDAYLGAKELLRRFPQSIHFSHKVLKIVFNLIPWAKVKRTPTYKSLYESVGRSPSICYGINAEAFNNELTVNRKILPLSASVQDFFRFEPKYHNVFVFDALVEQNVINTEQLHLFWEWFLDSFENIANGISIKFHPFQNTCSKSLITKELENRSILFEVIPDSISMETFFVLNEECEIYGIGSSLLKYSYLKNKKRTHILYDFFDKELGFVCNRKASWDAIFK